MGRRGRAGAEGASWPGRAGRRGGGDNAGNRPGSGLIGLRGCGDQCLLPLGTPAISFGFPQRLLSAKLTLRPLLELDSPGVATSPVILGDTQWQPNPIGQYLGL